ncbi:M20/M25/M40 family metallo-hydrolase [Urbifossiella limnaea]|uniref:Carboxypeptidase Q n=1 Tax=Urbifossiella limnaea TaxID=2528023 RepID=A0A517Y2T6_9BACT|nr:M20/M25/M40 family metallo-hydrolase [Urbifossiella limnaea]QDU24052.1 Bacterial leucyl aminopeptidase precursor [Urbifossiella limnaea]
MPSLPRPVLAAALVVGLAAAARTADPVKTMPPAELDQALLAEVKAGSEVAKNLQHLSDVIGPRLTGSKQLERANNWTAEIMKKYGLENVKLEPWEMPYGWERGTASLKVVEPDTKVNCVVAAWGWTPGTKGKITGPVVVLKVATRADLDKYKGKLKNAVIMTAEPAKVAPVTDLNYGPLPPPKKVEPKTEPKDEKKATLGAVFAQVQPEKKKEAQPEKKDEQPKRSTFTDDVEAFLVAEGAACRLQDSGKPHGLLAVSGNWKGTDRVPSPNIMPRLTVAHEYYAMLWRLANRPEPAETRVEVEITNTLVPGPVTCFNTVGEVKGSEKPDEFVVVGAHLDSWDLATGTMDNGTGTCSVLETARVVAAMAKKGYPPKRTIRFALFTGEEQGLWGSRKYVERHKDEMPKTSIALVHDTGTGKVYGFGVHGQAKVKEILERELTTVAAGEGWKGIDMGGVFGSDHQAFHPAGVPGLACRQDIDEYRLTHHTQTDTFDHAKTGNLSQAAGVLSITATRIANLPELLPRMTPFTRPKKD